MTSEFFPDMTEINISMLRRFTSSTLEKIKAPIIIKDSWGKPIAILSPYKEIEN